MLTRLRLGLRAFEWLPFPWRFSRLDLERPRGLPAAHGGLPLRALPRAAADGQGLLDARLRGRPARSRSGSASRRAARWPTARCPSPPARWARRAPQGDGEECDVVIVGSGAGGAAAAATLAEAGLDVIVLEAGRHYNRDSYPSDPLEAIASPLPRRRPDDRRGPPADPGSGGEGRRRDDRDQLRHLLPGPRPGARGLARSASGSSGRATSTPTSPRPRSSCASPRSTPSGWAATASSRWRGRGRSAPAAARSPATPAAACSAAPAPSAARSTPSAACTSATCRAPSPPGRGCEPGSRRAGSWSRAAARSACAAPPAAARRATAAGAPTPSAPAAR